MFSAELFAVVDANVDALFAAHGLAGLDRDVAFARMEDPAFIGMEQWTFRYGKHQLHPSVLPISERIPYAAWWFWFVHGDTDLAFGPLAMYHVIDDRTMLLAGADIWLMHDSSRLACTWALDGRSVEPDLILFLTLRAELLSCTQFVESRSGPRPKGSYVFKEGASFMGVALEGQYSLGEYFGYSIHDYDDSDRSEWPEIKAGKRFYDAHGFPTGHAWLATLK
jgi:hypothetical protein